MGQDYSYSQPDSSDEYDRYSQDTEEREVEALIRMDEAESNLLNTQATLYPPQPEVEFGFPKVCYCGGQPILSSNENRRFFTCGNVDDGDMHIHKWWDAAVMEEISEMNRQRELLTEKVDSITFACDYDSHIRNETEQKIAQLEKIVFEQGKSRNKFRY
ncbi:PREDICTED: uncharacterized protein LOC104789431 [Camelina sativa]|uniref:Uncharacterized protein LOC104715978 n=1 Tax=Camelina sativa TaxID=90675 RepID=A0ABM1QL69_CAMSA|nr:PREDICTED: uncharacterized protein LOC104715978 [Camelina sativa]XP_019087507.1 PREDICTED: uncharacterized protein LOC104728370 [Camelina sativa]XP_019095604.1 PREDICTED: uncharacterized protein LOC104763311 [Camelina sativa]XP_019100882.1 PREDICTED: uncharacterized protein LOC104789431 [Camelina sativa]